MVRPDWVAASLTTLDGVVVVLDLGPRCFSLPPTLITAEIHPVLIRFNSLSPVLLFSLCPRESRVAPLPTTGAKQ